MRHKFELAKTAETELQESLDYKARADKLREIQFDIYRKSIFLPLFSSVAAIALFGTVIARSEFDPIVISYVLPSMWAYVVSFIIGIILVTISGFMVHFKEQQFAESLVAQELWKTMKLRKVNQSIDERIETIDYIVLDKLFSSIDGYKNKFDRMFFFGKISFLLCCIVFAFGTIYPLIKISNLTEFCL